MAYVGPFTPPGGGTPTGARAMPGSSNSRTSNNEAKKAFAKSTERIYTATQLVAALKSGLVAVRDQLQVLSILDGTALSWPGVQQAADDLEFLIDMSAQQIGRMETRANALEGDLARAQEDAITLREALTESNQTKDRQQLDITGLNKELKLLQAKLANQEKEVQQQKQELWTLEKQRADLASECEKFKQDHDFMEGELSTLRSQVAEQQQQITTLKEELAGRRSDVKHLMGVMVESKEQVEQLKQQLAAANNQLQTTQGTLATVRQEKAKFESEASRLTQDNARLQSELAKANKELGRLRDWQEVMKKVDADKQKEQSEAVIKAKTEATLTAAELEKKIVALQAEVSKRDEFLKAKTAEVENLSKQMALLNFSVKDLQKQLSTSQAEASNATRQRDELKAQVEKLQVQAAQVAQRQAQLDKDKFLMESQIREQFNKEKATIQTQLEEARKELSLQKTIADGSYRDIKAVQDKLASESAKATELQSQLEKSTRELETLRYDLVKAQGGVDQQAKVMAAQVTALQEENKRVRVQAASQQKHYEKVVEGLRRENDAAAAELQRLKGMMAQGGGTDGQFVRLPVMNYKSITVDDDLNKLKHELQHWSPQNLASTAPGGRAISDRNPSLPMLAAQRSAPVAVNRNPTR